ncbi:Fidgetin-like protein 1 [Heracleum sosnowskyi]|uniref:Fidgetin-like protein 1 n=1 Tax=Heracleum sosnowskyi TaxID=360622 RepID=A0AAD8JI68_9APIA|nr:Fidgetin-like protein 1 [Heracleum sosnowskyi]
MGSLEEDKLFEMVHDFIESDSSPSHFSTSSLHPSNYSLYQTTTFILQEVLKSVTAAETQVTEDVFKFMRQKLMVADTTSSFKEWLVTRLKLDGYDASLCHTSWVTTIACPAGEYEYIGITTNRDKNGDESKKRLVVDIDFKSQFELARPTAAYMKLLGSVPPVFVGDTDKLNKVITFLCSAAKQSFKDNNIYMPPWRTFTFMQAKYKLSLDDKKKNTDSAATSKTGSNWEPPKVKAKNIGTRGPSGLSCQFSTNFTTTCC